MKAGNHCSYERMPCNCSKYCALITNMLDLLQFDN